MDQPQGVGVWTAVHLKPSAAPAREASSVRQGTAHASGHLGPVVQDLGPGPRPDARGDGPRPLDPGQTEFAAVGSNHFHPGTRGPSRGIVTLVIGENPRVTLTEHPGRSPGDAINAIGAINTINAINAWLSGHHGAQHTQGD